MAYDIPGGWYIAFDPSSGAPFYLHKEINDGATTWSPPWLENQYANKEHHNQCITEVTLAAKNSTEEVKAAAPV